MKKPSLFVAGLMICLIGFDSCTKKIETIDPNTGTVITDDSFYKSIKDYSKFLVFPNTPSQPFDSKISKVHGNSIKVYINQIGYDGIDKTNKKPKASEMPEGTIIIKEIYSGNNIDLLAVMKKQKGATGNNWLWAEYKQNGSTAFSVNNSPKTCTSCHESGKDNIRIFEY